MGNWPGINGGNGCREDKCKCCVSVYDMQMHIKCNTCAVYKL